MLEGEKMIKFTYDEIERFKESREYKYINECLSDRIEGIKHSLLYEKDIIKINRLQAEYEALKSVINLVERGNKNVKERK